MCKEPVDGSLLIHVPDTNTLIVRTTSHEFIIPTNNDIPDPFFVTMKGPGVKASTNLPQLDRFIPGTTDQEIPIHDKVHKGNIVVMSMESLAAKIIIIQVP